MQRLLLLLATLFALYACTGTVPHKPAEEKPAIAPAIEQPAEAAPAEAPPPAPVEVPPPLAIQLAPDAVPHVALLLPLQSPAFGASANAVQQGFLAAANNRKQALPLRIYSNFDENTSAVEAYRMAVASGAKVVVGPLTRNGVAALAAEPEIPVPTLALNIVEAQPAERLYFFGMAVEAEARQAAQLARKQNLQQAIIVTMRSPLSQRMQTAFEEAWGSAGGGILREIEFNSDPAVFADIADIADAMVFLAADAGKARLIRPYLPNKLPIYASSQIFSGNENTLTNYDLNGIRFVDMPWLLQPDHPAVMIYPRANPPLGIDHERLYALGIDAFRLSQLLLGGNLAALPLDGVSGRIRLNGHIFQREALPARFVEGQARLADAPVVPVQMFPGQAPASP